MLATTSRIPIEDLGQLGWENKPEGLCRGDVCVPLPAGAIEAGGTIDLDLLGARLHRSVVHDEAVGLHALGPEYGAPTIAGVDAPELTLPDLRTGQDFSLSTLRGKKVVLVSWASW